jgi:hypothetical protein
MRNAHKILMGKRDEVKEDEMAGHVARMGTKISGHRVLVGKSN